MSLAVRSIAFSWNHDYSWARFVCLYLPINFSNKATIFNGTPNIPILLASFLLLSQLLDVYPSHSVIHILWRHSWCMHMNINEFCRIFGYAVQTIRIKPTAKLVRSYIWNRFSNNASHKIYEHCACLTCKTRLRVSLIISWWSRALSSYCRIYIYFFFKVNPHFWLVWITHAHTDPDELQNWANNHFRCKLENYRIIEARSNIWYECKLFFIDCLASILKTNHRRRKRHFIELQIYNKC